VKKEKEDISYAVNVAELKKQDLA